MTLEERLTRYQQQLQEQVVRRAQLTELLSQADESVKRLEGACGVLRELMQDAPVAQAPTGPNGADPAEDPA